MYVDRLSGIPDRTFLVCMYEIWVTVAFFSYQLLTKDLSLSMIRFGENEGLLNRKRIRSIPCMVVGGRAPFRFPLTYRIHGRGNKEISPSPIEDVGTGDKDSVDIENSCSPT